jgi:hypothetical protein
MLSSLVDYHLTLLAPGDNQIPYSSIKIQLSKAARESLLRKEAAAVALVNWRDSGNDFSYVKNSALLRRFKSVKGIFKSSDPAVRYAVGLYRSKTASEIRRRSVFLQAVLVGCSPPLADEFTGATAEQVLTSAPEGTGFDYIELDFDGTVPDAPSTLAHPLGVTATKGLHYRLYTLHECKGMTLDTVVLSDGFCDLASGDSGELRVLYTAITRVRKHLVLNDALARTARLSPPPQLAQDPGAPSSTTSLSAQTVPAAAEATVSTPVRKGKKRQKRERKKAKKPKKSKKRPKASAK